MRSDCGEAAPAGHGDQHTLAAITLLVAGVIASLLPALRTTKVDPVVALRA